MAERPRLHPLSYQAPNSDMTCTSNSWAVWVGSLWVSTYAYFDGPSIFEGLAGRLDAVPSLKVKLLSSPRDRQGCA